MQIDAARINDDVVITLEDASGEQYFSGYRLERKVHGGAWLVWTGTNWEEAGQAQLLTAPHFTDYDLSEGLYQYRYRIEYTQGGPGDYLGSPWLTVGEGKVGWTFGNYTPPEGTYGEVLTADDLRHTYCWGIEFTASNGEEYSDEQIRAAVDSTVREFERALSIDITKKSIKCRPAEDLVLGTDFDLEEDPYPFRADKWRREGRLALRHRPVLSVERFGLYTITGQRILDLLTWVKLDKRKGVASFFPQVGPGGVLQGASVFYMSAGVYFAGGDYAHGYQIDYTVGEPDARFVPADLRDIIGKGVACKLLNIIGDGLIAGFSSSSLSLDGISESFSSTQSATNAYFGARIGVYLKDIETYLKRNRHKFGRFVMGNI